MEQYEQQLQQSLGSGEVVAVSSGTTALHTALAALGIGPGDEVLVPALAVPMSAAPVVHLGARPVVVDLDQDEHGLDLDDLAAKTSPRTRAILPVLMWGRADPTMARVIAHARKHGLAVVADAAQAIGTTVTTGPPHHAVVGSDGPRQAGLEADITCFSTQRQKILTTGGEGGFVTTRDPELADRARRYRSHGVLETAPRSAFAQAHESTVRTTVGHNFRLADALAELGLQQLAVLPELVARRRAQRETLTNLVAGHPRLLPIPPPEPGWNSYAALFRLDLPRPRQFCRHLAALGVPNSTGSFGLVPLDQRPGVHTPVTRGRPRALRAAAFLDHLLAVTLNQSDDDATLSRHAETINREAATWADCSRT